MKTASWSMRWVLWFVLTALCVTAKAQIYTWTDANGKKHFSDGATRPKDRETPEVKVPPANVANRFQPAPQAPEPPSEAVVASPPAVPPPPQSGRPLSAVDRSQNACRAQWDAFDNAVACYAECGKALSGFRGRNNAACGHCTDVPKPNC